MIWISLLHLIALESCVFGGISYEITRLGFLCSNVRHEIKSEAECKNAAAILGLQWAHVWNGPKDFPGCLYAQDWRNKVFFNLSPNPGRVNVSPKYSAICIVDKAKNDHGVHHDSSGEYGYYDNYDDNDFIDIRENIIKKEGEECGPCFSPDTDFFCGECEIGMDCLEDPNNKLLPDAPAKCQKRSGSSEIHQYETTEIDDTYLYQDYKEGINVYDSEEDESYNM